MTREQIEAKIRFCESRLAEVTHPQDIATLNRCLERLIMMEADDEKDSSGG